MVIPPLIHHIWLGPTGVPEECETWMQTWAKHHPGWDIRLWDEGCIPDDLLRPEVYDRMRAPVERSNLLRFELLHRFGGVYVDCDVECLKPIEDLLDGVAFCADQGWKRRANVAFLASVPGHAVPRAVLAAFKARTAWGGQPDGPGALRGVIQGRADVTLIDPAEIAPRDDDERSRAHMVHHEMSSWWDEGQHRKARDRLTFARHELARAQSEIEKLEKQVADLQRAQRQPSRTGFLRRRPR